MSQRRTKRQLQVYRDEPETTAESSSQPFKRSRNTTDGQPSLTPAQPTLLADGVSNLRDVGNFPNRAPRLVPGESLVSELVDPEPGTSLVLAATTFEAHLLLALSIAAQPQQRPNAVQSQLDPIALQPRLIAARQSQRRLRPITSGPSQPQQQLITARTSQLQLRSITRRPLQPQQRLIAPRSPQTQQQCVASRPSQPQPQLIAPQPQPHSIASSSPTAPVTTLQAHPQTHPPIAFVTALQEDTPTREPSLSYAFPTSPTALSSTLLWITSA